MEDHRSRCPNPKYSREEPRTHINSPRERDTHRGRNEDRHRERDRRYRSRSRDSRPGRRGWKDDRDEKDTRYRDERDNRYRDKRREDWDDRGRIRERHSQKETRESDRESHRERSRSRKRHQSGRDKNQRDSRSKSPKIEQISSDHREKVSSSKESEKIDELTMAPPVSFKVGSTQEPDRIDVDSIVKKPSSEKTLKHKVVESEREDEEDEVVIEEEEDDVAAMKAIMGFGGFSTTHQKKVPGNNISAVRKEKKTEYRQYMNRVGGFNRPLSPSR